MVSNSTRGFTEFITLAEDEHIIKEYEAAKMIAPYKLDVNIALTTKRVVFYGRGNSWFGLGENRLVNEVHINKIIGTNVFNGRSFSLIQLIIGALIALAGLSSISNREPGNGIIILIVGIIIIIYSIKTTFSVEIKAETTTPISVGKERASITKPAKDSELLVKEIGAMILDIQLNGAELLENLKCQNSSCTYIRSFDEKPKHCPECGIEWF